MGRLVALLTIVAAVAGLAAGWALHDYADEALRAEVSRWLAMVIQAFLRLLRMTVSPLLFTVLISSVGRMGEASSRWRFPGFLFALVLTGALFAAYWLAPAFMTALTGTPVTGPVPAGPGAVDDPTTWQALLTRVVPASMIDALAKNELLQVTVAAWFVGAGLLMAGDGRARLLALVDQGTRIMLTVAGFVLRLSPLVVFALLASVVAETGIRGLPL